MHAFNVITLFAVLTLVGVESSVSVFIHPAAARLAPDAQLTIISRVARVLGQVMPIWYPLCAVLFGIETRFFWQDAARAVLLVADAIWVLTSLASIVFLVPLNNRVAEGAADWQQLHRTWDGRHRVRIVALASSALLLLWVVAR